MRIGRLPNNLFFLALGALLVLATQTLADPLQPGWGSAQPGWQADPGSRMGALLQDLDLDEEQMEALADMRAVISQRRGPDARRLSTGELFSHALNEDPPDREAIHASIQQQLDANEEAAHALLDAFLDFRATLTPAQLQTLRQRVATYRQRMMDRSTRNRCWWWMDGE